MGEDMENIYELLNKNGTKVLISGDSLSYNRYDFDPKFRVEASLCYPGMASWSTLVLEAIYQNDPYYIFGDSIAINGCESTNMLPECEEPMCMLYRSLTAITENGGSLSFNCSCSTDRIVLYLQKRPDTYSCLFDIYVDGRPAASDVSTFGSPEWYHGWERFMIILAVAGTCEHIVEFRNIRCTGTAYITLTGVGSRDVEVYHSGIGNRTVSFFIENFEERIGRYKPDIFIFSIGANDQAYLSQEQFETGLQNLTDMILKCSPKCKIIYIAPGRGQQYDEPDKSYPADIAEKDATGRIAYFSSYNEILNEHAEKTGAICIDMFRLFENIPIPEWRFDNIHLTKHGNTILAKQVIHTLMPNGYYSEELIDANRQAAY